MADQEKETKEKAPEKAKAKKTSTKAKTGTVSKKIEKILPSAEEMLKAGVHFGHRKSKWHPKMKPYIFGTRENVHIIDLEKSREKLAQALEFLAGVKEKDGKVLFVGTKVSAKSPVKEAAEDSDMPYVVDRWIGGTLTNFDVISKRLEYFRDLEKKKQQGELKKYTKREQQSFSVELEKLEKQFGGVKNMTKLPSTLILVGAANEKNAADEARNKNIPIVALCDSNSNPEKVDYPIPANDDAVSSLNLILNTLVEVLK